MPARSHKKRSSAVTTEVIVDRISQAVLEQRLPIGAKLVEEKLCEIFGVSRTKVRQALNRLAQHRLVTLKPRRGAFVAKPSVSEARAVFDARRVVEREIAARFVEIANASHFLALESHLAAERDAIDAGNVPLRNRLLGLFHVKIGEFAGNAVLAEILAGLVSRSSLVTLLFQSNRSVQCSTSEHADVLAAFKARDAARAVELMDLHLAHVEDDLSNLPEKATEIDLAAALGAQKGFGRDRRMLRGRA